MDTPANFHEVIIVGGGPSGLSAALVLARCRREVLVIDSGKPRNWASHAVGGFFTRDGTHPKEMLRLGREQLGAYACVKLLDGEVTEVTKNGERFHVVMRGEAQQPFTYTPIGELALVGKRKGVARVYNMNFSGFIAYAMWRGVYLMKMPSMKQRLRVLSDWCLDLWLGPVGEYHASSTRNPKQLAQAGR